MTQQLKVHDQAPTVTLVDGTGAATALADVFGGRKTLLTFLRHFGCLFCREWLAKLAQHQAELDGAGLQVVAVAMGDPKHIARYCDRIAPDITCLTGDDGSLEAYHAYGLQEGGLKQFTSFDALKAGFRAIKGGHAVGKATGNVRMMPGTFLIDAEGRVRWTYYSEHVGDHPDIADILSVKF